MPPSSSGLGRYPFKVEIAGSNPAGGTTFTYELILDVAAGRRPSPAGPCPCHTLGGSVTTVSQNEEIALTICSNPFAPTGLTT